MDSAQVATGYAFAPGKRTGLESDISDIGPVVARRRLPPAGGSGNGWARNAGEFMRRMRRAGHCHLAADLGVSVPDVGSLTSGAGATARESGSTAEW